jgi:hypothetical protein
VSQINEPTKLDEAKPGGEPLVMPGDVPVGKLPLPKPPQFDKSGVELPPELMAAWTENMIQGFQQNQLMFQTTLRAFMKPYRLTVYLYGILFIVGLSLFVVATVIGFQKDNSAVAITFAGLGGSTFLAFFVRNPLQALEENLQFITCLGVAFNTYWTRLMYMSDPNTIQDELKAADQDFRASVVELVARKAERRASRQKEGG